MVIIGCGNKKIDTKESVPAMDLYCGPIFKKVFQVARTLSSDIKILSAGYGLVDVLDLLENYNQKMNDDRAIYFRDNVKWPDEGSHILTGRYELATPRHIKGLVEPNIRMGYFLEAVCKIEKPDTLPLNLSGGIKRDFLEDSFFERKNRSVNNPAIFNFIRERFLEDWLSVREMNFLLIEKFGPPPGLSYYSTINTALRSQPIKYEYKKVNKKVNNKKNQFHYIEKKIWETFNNHIINFINEPPIINNE